VGTLLDEAEGIRSALVSVRLRFGDSNDLPLTVSGAVARFPEDGDSVTELLANAAITLREAKGSGGDSVLRTGFETGPVTQSHTFDVFQGLILAVDAKDRYTKRHSEDVARYGVYLARRMDLDPDLIRTIQVAGLLHDVGKIGIPDGILRKPGKLTDAEFEIVKQHVALGDMVVRDVPDIDLVRAGIRHHHERWDGDGYLDRLAGEEIPLIARILAVGDAFSAMTTTRPYRKALDLREALTRLEDAAGAQLDEVLVKAFVEGIETDADAPLPGVDTPAALWTPRRVA
jgi:HD-GYP domain-containing protein (c-di-GMP phosphodiesterase class II)